MQGFGQPPQDPSLFPAEASFLTEQAWFHNAQASRQDYGCLSAKNSMPNSAVTSPYLSPTVVSPIHSALNTPILGPTIPSDLNGPQISALTPMRGSEDTPMRTVVTQSLYDVNLAITQAFAEMQNVDEMEALQGIAQELVDVRLTLAAGFTKVVELRNRLSQLPSIAVKSQHQLQETSLTTCVSLLDGMLCGGTFGSYKESTLRQEVLKTLTAAVESGKLRQVACRSCHDGKRRCNASITQLFSGYSCNGNDKDGSSSRTGPETVDQSLSPAFAPSRPGRQITRQNGSRPASGSRNRAAKRSTSSSRAGSSAAFPAIRSKPSRSVEPVCDTTMATTTSSQDMSLQGPSSMSLWPYGPPTDVSGHSGRDANPHFEVPARAVTSVAPSVVVADFDKQLQFLPDNAIDDCFGL